MAPSAIQPNDIDPTAFEQIGLVGRVALNENNPSRVEVSLLDPHPLLTPLTVLGLASPGKKPDILDCFSKVSLDKDTSKTRLVHALRPVQATKIKSPDRSRSGFGIASIASAAALVHLVTFDPWSWGAMRLLTGFCFSGLYIVAESWLNGSANNESHASLLSVSFIIQTGGVMIGQMLLGISGPDGIILFIVVSILISFSPVPMLVSTSTTPPYELPERISLAELFRFSPMGLSGSFLNGIAQTTLYVVLAIYGSSIGLSSGAIGGLIGFMTLGGMLFQFPLSKLSDRMDRRLVMVGAPGLAIPVCFFLAMLENPVENSALLYAMIAVLG